MSALPGWRRSNRAALRCGHPLTPMSDPNLVRVLQRQSKGKVGLVPHQAVRGGRLRILDRFGMLRESAVNLAIADAICDEDRRTLAEACEELPLITGGSGLAMGLPAVYRAKGWLPHNVSAAKLPRVAGKSAVLAGSCSLATQRQVGIMKERAPSFVIDPRRVAEGKDVAADAIAWACERMRDGPVLVYATADAETVKIVQKELGVTRAGAIVEATMAKIACGLAQLGVRRFIVAGGETSAAVVAALGVSGLRIGGEIDPGVPWTVGIGERPFALALKSGNFGAPDFFLKAWSSLG